MDVYLVRKLGQVLQGRSGEPLLCPAGRDIGHGGEIVGSLELVDSIFSFGCI